MDYNKIRDLVLSHQPLSPVSSPVSASPVSRTCSGGHVHVGSTLLGNPCPRCGGIMIGTSCASGEQVNVLLLELMREEYGNIK